LRQGDFGTLRQGDFEREILRQGDFGTLRQGDFEIGRLSDKARKLKYIKDLI